MSFENLLAFKDKRVLLLQGPVGSFFHRFAADIRRLNATVEKINFNAGDDFFYPTRHHFRQPMVEFEAYLTTFLEQHPIDCVVMFGDCRRLHMVAKTVAIQRGVGVYVFEEGYLRPNHITLENQGVNGYSLLPDKVVHYLDAHAKEDIPLPAVIELGKTYWYAARWAILYYLAAGIGAHRYPHYQHHRPLTVLEALPWLRGGVRKWWFKWQERGIQHRLTTQYSQKFFLVPLQVYNDFQISHHSNYPNIAAFIEHVMASFAQHAPDDTIVVFKQHPFDRGYNDYGTLIRQLATSLQIEHRVLYIHDQHLPTLIRHARGVVVINSTVGLSAVGELKPVKVCGEAVYNLAQLTAQDDLDTFWRTSKTYCPNSIYVHQYFNYLSKHTQHNGSFYRRIPHLEHETGVLWTE